MSHRINNLVLILRLLSQSCAIDDETVPTTRIRVNWTGEAPQDEPEEKIYYRRMQPLHAGGMLRACKRQTTKGTYYTPNYWGNRIKGGEFRNLSSVVEYSADSLPSLGEFSLDIEAIAYPSDLNPAPQRDAMQTWQRLYEMQEEAGFNPRHRWPEGHTHVKQCSSCYKWDTAPDSGSGRRPPGPVNRDVCNGCIVSYLDERQPDGEQVKDELFTAWVAARENVASLELEKLDQQTPVAKKRWIKKRKRAGETLATAAENCKAAGLNVGARRYSPTLREGDEFLKPLEAPRVTAFFKNGP